MTGQKQAVDICISLRSSSKAAKNDYDPDSDWRNMLKALGLDHMGPDRGDSSQEPASALLANNVSTSPNFPASAGEDDSEHGQDSFSDVLSADDEFAEFEWLEQIDGRAIEDKKQLAVCSAKLIRRDHIKAGFWEEMEEPTQETSQLAFELFDRYGRLKPKFYEHEFKRGTGVWGSELDDGDILLIEVLCVAPEKRRTGLGTEIVQKILEKVRPKTRRFIALVSPGFLSSEVPEGDDDEKQHQIAASLQFWRSLGFRRVGTSSWFAFVNDLDHPSHKLAICDDLDDPPHMKHDSSLLEPFKEAIDCLSHLRVPQEQCLLKIQEFLPDDTDDARWMLADESGHTVLHHAAMNSRPEVVNFIFCRCADLAKVRNREGNTPLEALQARLESKRSADSPAGLPNLSLVRSDNFTGFSQCSLACIGVLTDKAVFDLDSLSSEDASALSAITKEPAHLRDSLDVIRHTLRLKYGCTCGECIGGFLSPRMKFALLCQAETQYETLYQELSAFDKSDWLFENMLLCNLKCLTPAVKQSLKTSKSMRQGFVTICKYIAECLSRKKLPTAKNVRDMHQLNTSEWPPVTRNYLERGGTVAAAAIMLFQFTRGDSASCGNGQHEEMFGDEIQALAKCRNDDEFKFVGNMCGFKEI
ncbi:hypothetical protein BD289DRAFT_482998 [Coniella lustricola]|uniref:N-acetyltransferase domain-containing protein n=1 Tax=Coniella lustricola TaxID=2025994 RepID=A0A2T3A708_9PEZI|nr:hypothetical protein BD289DRAFT_482998 [Coniella lustricola]